MAYSIQTAVGPVTSLTITILYSSASAELNVYLNGVLQTYGATYTVSYQTLTFTPAVAAGVKIVVVRRSQISSMKNIFSTNAQFRPAQIDDALKQLLWLCQEAREGSDLRQLYTNLDMQGFQLQTLGPATTAGNAVEYSQYATSLTGMVAQVNAATTQANAASASAAAAAASASVAVSPWVASGLNIGYTRGSVGVGTGTPEHKFHAYANVGAVSGVTRAAVLEVATSSAAAGDGTGLGFVWGSRAAGSINAVRESPGAHYGTALVFQNNPALGGSGTFGGLVERLRLDSNGDLHIGQVETSAGTGRRMTVSNYENTSPWSSSGVTLWTRSTSGASTSAFEMLKDKYGNAVLSNTEPSANCNIALMLNGSIKFRVSTPGTCLATYSTGLGYGVGSGGTVTQATSKATAVTLNKPTGTITMAADSMAPGAVIGFNLFSSAFAVDDVLIVNVASNVNIADYNVWGTVATAGRADVYLKNISAGTRAEAVQLKFALIKGSST